MWQQQGQWPGRLHPLHEVWPGEVAVQQNAPSAEGVGAAVCSASAAGVAAGGRTAAWGRSW